VAAFTTPDLCDDHPDRIKVVNLPLRSFGGKATFAGPVATIKCFEDNSKVKEQAAQPGKGRVMVVDGGGSTRHALLGDLIAAGAVDNGWAGFVIWGCIRDVDVIANLDLGVKALGACPVKTEKRGLGDVDIAIRVGGVSFSPGDWVYADNNGVIRADGPLT
jgi:regulator of ribonuclease activity A